MRWNSLTQKSGSWNHHEFNEKPASLPWHCLHEKYAMRCNWLISSNDWGHFSICFHISRHQRVFSSQNTNDICEINLKPEILPSVKLSIFSCNDNPHQAYAIPTGYIFIGYNNLESLIFMCVNLASTAISLCFGYISKYIYIHIYIGFILIFEKLTKGPLYRSPRFTKLLAYEGNLINFLCLFEFLLILWYDIRLVGFYSCLSLACTQRRHLHEVLIDELGKWPILTSAILEKRLILDF